jgi:hypothetical protein
MTDTDIETLKRWRMMLGGDNADGTGVRLDGEEMAKDQALAALYDFEINESFNYGNKVVKLQQKKVAVKYQVQV